VREEPHFEEAPWVDRFVGVASALEADLPQVFDYAVPCFPPSYTIFDRVFQYYHVRFAGAVDTVGRRAGQLSTKTLLILMQWVSGYQDTLRNLGAPAVPRPPPAARSARASGRSELPHALPLPPPAAHRTRAPPDAALLTPPSSAPRAHTHT